MKGLALAHRAPARPGQAIPFVEDEAALGAFRRLDDEAPAGPVQRLTDMLQVAGDLLLGNTYQPGELPGRVGPLLQLRHDQATDRIVRLGGRTGPFIALIVLPDHEISILPFPDSGCTRQRPEDDRNISIGRLDKHQRSATILVKNDNKSKRRPAKLFIVTARKRGS